MAERQIAEVVERMKLSDSRRAEVKMYPRQLLKLAGSLVEEEQRHWYNLAIIVANMACELAVEQVFNNLLDQKNISNLQRFIIPRDTSYNICAPKIKDIYNELANDRIQRDENAFWKPLTDSVKHRNDIVHRGIMFERGDAEKSLRAVSDLISYLDQKFGTS